jgi:ornithine cyclodeaminase/alanine dehydrogenase-like protein (mu-crystallin family)
MLVLSQPEVKELLDLDALVDAVAAAMADLSAGNASMPARSGALVAERSGLLAVMPAYVPAARALTTKLVSLFPMNEGSSTPTHQALIAVFDHEDGRPVALMDGTHITATRTAAGSALSVRLLARDDTATLAILGTGVQARAHAHAVTRVASFDEVRLAGRDGERTAAVAAELAHELGRPVRACSSHAEALDSADVVCACTSSAGPVVCREWLSSGTHVTSVGYDPSGREVDDATVVDALVIVESRTSALAPAPAGTPDLVEPISRGLIGPEHIHAEIGELVAGTRPGRADREQVTLYKSVGVAVQDAAAAALVLAAARESGAGREVDI